MATQKQQTEATIILQALAEANSLPSSLRAPLRAVRDGVEIPGTAEDVLSFARQVANRTYNLP